MASPQDTFARWGRPTAGEGLKPPARAFLQQQLGRPAPRPAAPSASIALPASNLPAAARAALADAVGAAQLDEGRAGRLAHSGGSSLADLVRRRDGGELAAPDAVVHPASHDEVLAVLAACSAHAVAVVPFGAGTSVVGGVEPLRAGRQAVVAVAFDRLADLVAVDEESLLATVQPGMTGPVLERLLAARGLTWGHLPQSWERASIGGYVATRSAGQASTGYGRSDETVAALVVATPAGTLRLGRGPASAAGPDLRQLFVGGEGVLGIITEVVLRVRRRPVWEYYEGLMLPSFHAGTAAFRELAQSDLTASVMRLSDEAETRATLTMSGPGGRAGDLLDRYLRARGVAAGCLVVLGWEAVAPKAGRARREAALAVLRRHGAVSLGARPGRSWRAHRFGGPYLRDELLDAGYLVETLETATSWARLPALHRSVGAAVGGALAGPQGPAYVMSHVSHVYETGASLYVTALAAAEPDRAAHWARAKAAAGDAITAAGATITHHHAVGADHVPWMRAEIGDLGVDVLAAVKGAVDPAGVLNPGKLLPQGR
jgi:alkyldihydroxyacetonephosphate synthase